MSSSFAKDSSGGNSMLPASSSSSEEDYSLRPEIALPVVDQYGVTATIFRSAYNIRHLTTDDIARSAKTELGAQYLIQFFNNAQSNSDRDYVIQAMVLDVYDMMVDQHGHLALSKICEAANQTQVEKIIKKLVGRPGSLVSAACNIYGSKVLQVIIKEHKTLSGAMKKLTKALCPYFCLLMSRRNARSVIRDCFMYLDEDTTQSLFEQVRLCCLIVGQDKLGLCINYVGRDRQDALLHIVLQSCLHLVTNQSGSTVVRQVLLMRHPVYTPAIVERLILSEKLVKFATDEYGSFVIRDAITAITSTEGNNPGLYARLRTILWIYYREYLQINKYGKKVYRVLEDMELRTEILSSGYNDVV